jgi:hypothetical protein
VSRSKSTDVTQLFRHGQTHLGDTLTFPCLAAGMVDLEHIEPAHQGWTAEGEGIEVGTKDQGARYLVTALSGSQCIQVHHAN